jgi:hypothetical protein
MMLPGGLSGEGVMRKSFLGSLALAALIIAPAMAADLSVAPVYTAPRLR